MSQIEQAFYDRADEHINLSNQQLTNATRGKVSASMLYSVARFNAWVTACGHASGEAMLKQKEEAIRYFVEEYTKMLTENLDEYIENFDTYMKHGAAGNET